VICWDWTKAIARCDWPKARRLIFSAGDLQGLRRDALGLSHLT
jgi:hypothetical protein